MRHARLKPSAQDTGRHCYNRAVGNRNDRPFNRVEDAADYRFCSYGRWRQSGRHPFAVALEAHLIPCKRHTNRMSPGDREPPYSAAGVLAFVVQRSGIRVPISLVFSSGMRRITSSR